jgi:hypothetical protein
MTEEEWHECSNPRLMVEYLRSRGTDRKLRLLGCACVRSVWSLTGEQVPTVIETVERFADSSATKAGLRRFQKELREARDRLDGEDARTRLMWGATWLTEVLATGKAFRSIAAEMERLEGVFVFQNLDWQMIEHFVRDIFGNPFRPVVLDPRWRTSDVLGLARAIYEDKAFDRLPILADTLMDAGCADEQILTHCRGDGRHVRGCWVVDLVLGKE